MPFDLVIDEQTAWGEEARVSQDERVRQLGRDRRRAALLRRPVRQAARVDRGNADPDGSRAPLRDAATRRRSRTTPSAARRRSCCKRRVEYFGFELEREIEAVDEFPAGREDEARRVLAEALARGEARHFAVRDEPAAHRRGARGVSALGRRAAAAEPGRARGAVRGASSAGVRSLDGVQAAPTSISPRALETLVAARRARAVRRAADARDGARPRGGDRLRRRGGPTAGPSAWRGCGCRRSRALAHRRRAARARPAGAVRRAARPARRGARARRSTSSRRSSTSRGRRRRSRGSTASATSSATRRRSATRPGRRGAEARAPRARPRPATRAERASGSEGRSRGRGQREEALERVAQRAHPDRLLRRHVEQVLVLAARS